MRECKSCGTLYPDHYTKCPSCKGEAWRTVLRKERYTELDEKTGKEEVLLMAVAGDCKFDIESK